MKSTGTERVCYSGRLGYLSCYRNMENSRVVGGVEEEGETYVGGGRLCGWSAVEVWCCVVRGSGGGGGRGWKCLRFYGLTLDDT